MKAAGRSQRRFVIGGIIIAAAIAGIAMALVDVAKRPPWPDFGIVEPGLIYRSGQIRAADIELFLRSHDIKEIVFLSNDRDTNADVTAEAAASAKLGIVRRNFPLSGDGTGNIIQYARALTAIYRCVNEHQPVLVHCATGAQRTGACIYFYRVLVEHWPADKAQAELFAFGHDPKSNPNLLPYIHDHQAELAELLKQRHVISDVKPATEISTTAPMEH